MRIFRICYSPEGTDGNGQGDQGSGDQGDIQSQIEAALTAETGTEQNQGAEKSAQGIDKGPKAGEPAAKSGEGDTAALKAKSAQVEDPDIDLEDGKDEQDKPKTKKVKLSELKKGYMLHSDYTKKTQEIAEQRKELSELANFAKALQGDKDFGNLVMGIIRNSMTDKGYNKEFISRAMGVLQEKIDDKKDQLEAKDEEIEAILKDLDADNPIAIALRKASKTNATMASQLQAIQNKLDAIDKSSSEEKARAANESHQKEVNDIRNVFSSTIDKLTDPKAPEAFKFHSEKAKERWRKDVAEVMVIKAKQGEIKDFVGELTAVAKLVYDDYTQDHEAHLAAYLKNKGAEPKKEVVKEKKKENLELQDELEKELQDALNTKEK